MSRNSDYCVLTLPLLTEPWQEHILETRFTIMEQMINSLISLELRKLKNLQRTKAYRELEKKIEETPKEERKELHSVRQAMLQNAGFTKFAFIHAMGPIRNHFKEHFVRDIANRAAEDVWRSFEFYLYNRGKRIQVKEPGTLKSISSVRPFSGMIYQDGLLRWDGGRCENKSLLSIKVAAPTTEYEKEMLQMECKYYRVVRKWMKTRYKYYLQFVLVGKPVVKDRPISPGRVGIAIGTQSIAVVSEQGKIQRELAEQVHRNQAKISKVREKMVASTRSMNPEYYNADGSLRQTRKPKLKKSNHYRKLEGQLRELHRKNAAIRTYQHNCLANDILALGTDIYVVDVGSTADGENLVEKAPSLLLSILEQKLKNLGYQDAVHRFDLSNFNFGEQYQTQLNQPYSEKLQMQGDFAAAQFVMEADAATPQHITKRTRETKRKNTGKRKEYARIPWADQYRDSGFVELTDEQWSIVAPLLPQDNRVGGRRSRTDDRQILNGILCVLSGTPWQKLPSCYGHWRTVFERFKKWGENGTLNQIFQALQQNTNN